MSNELTVGVGVVVTQEEEMRALREQLKIVTMRALLAERQLNEVVMSASVKIAAARMVLSRTKAGSAEVDLAIQGVLDVLPRDTSPPQRRLR